MFRLAFASLLLFAFSAQAASWPDLSRPPEQAGGEHDAALVVGIEQYESAPAIAGAVQNAQDWFVYLTRGRRLSPANVTLLRNREATREKLLKYAAEAAGHVAPGGTLWVVFIGHGAPAKDGRDGVLVGWDAQQDADSLYARSVSQKELLAALAKGRQAHTVVLLDACFSGRTAAGELVPGMQPLVAVTKPAQALASTVVLTAGKADQFAGPLPGAARPAFSYLMLGALRGWGDRDHDGKVTARESLEYLREVFGAVVKDRTQTPELEGRDEGLVLSSPAKEAGPDLVDLALEQGAPPRAPLPVPAPPVVAAPAVVPAGPSPLADCAVEGVRGANLTLKCPDDGSVVLRTLEGPPQVELEKNMASMVEKWGSHFSATKTARAVGGQLALIIDFDFRAMGHDPGARLLTAAVPEGSGSRLFACVGGHSSRDPGRCPAALDYVLSRPTTQLLEETGASRLQPAELAGRFTCVRRVSGMALRTGSLAVTPAKHEPESRVLAFEFPPASGQPRITEAGALQARRAGPSGWKGLASDLEVEQLTGHELRIETAGKASLELTGTLSSGRQKEEIGVALSWDKHTFERRVFRSADQRTILEDRCTRP